MFPLNYSTLSILIVLKSYLASQSETLTLAWVAQPRYYPTHFIYAWGYHAPWFSRYQCRKRDIKSLHYLYFEPNNSNEKGNEAIPITVLSGFLGSGKTTLLQYMLANSEGIKIAVVVNDVASINIDSKLVRGQVTATFKGREESSQDLGIEATSVSPAGIVELQNGCACCSQSGELLNSVSELITLSDLRHDDEKFDHIVIEMSGVAEPRSVRNIFQEAMMYDMPLMDRIRLDTLVTVIDCSTFLDYLKSSKDVDVNESPELFSQNEIEQNRDEKEMNGFWMQSLPIEAQVGVCDLLVGQTEVADVILLNKVDLLDGSIHPVKEIVTALNPRAKVIESSFAKLKSLSEILAYSKGAGVVIEGVVDDHKDYVNAADAQNHLNLNSEIHHNHDHSHDESNHSVEGSNIGSICKDEKCMDRSHSHSHHVIESPSTLSHNGIGTFVYRARRPFHPSRLLSLLQTLPVVRGIPMEEKKGTEFDETTIKAFQHVLRSKGFAWTADSNIKALYWSHAGTSFEMQCLGRWWTTLPKNQWPVEARDSILADFDSLDHDEAFVSPQSVTVGDRRQEVVFIGPGIGSKDIQAIIQIALDSCLLNNVEWDIFRARRDDESFLTSYFENKVKNRMLAS